jgi:hypothetical protein
MWFLFLGLVIFAVVALIHWTPNGYLARASADHVAAYLAAMK